MRADPPVRVPVGAEADRWTTVAFRRTVLAVTRTVTTTTRLLDVLDLVREDPRIQIVFTLAPGSAFTDGVLDFIRSFGGRLVPWEQAVRERFDLAVTASEAGDLHLLDAPVVVLPHGVGHNKYIKTARVVSGFRPDQLVRGGRVVPTALVLSHEEQLDQLAESCPEALPRAVVAGDVCLERLLAGRPHRARYRRVLGVGDHRRLVVVNSTWGRGSLVGRDLRLVRRLLTALPVDEYAVALVLHPAVWFGHSPYQVRGWLRPALDAGLLLVPPHEGWRATLLAADVLVSDHGSLSLYGAALGLPLLLGAFDDEEVVPSGPMAALARHAPRLDPGADLRRQLDTAIADHDPHRYDHVTNRAFALRGHGTGALRTLLYDTMSLPEDGPPATARPVDDPAPEVRRVTAHRVTTSTADRTVRLARFPATPAEPPWSGGDQHLAVEEDSLDAALRDNAAVLLSATPVHDAESWGRAALAANPGARVAAAPGTLVVRARDTTRVFDVRGEHDLAASAAYALLAARRLDPGEVVVHTGTTTRTVHLRER